MAVNRINHVDAYDSYAAKLYRQHLDSIHVQRISEHRQKILKEEKTVEASSLNEYNDAQRVARNQMIFNHYREMQLYLFKCMTLQLQQDKNIQLGTKVDSYT